MNFGAVVCCWLLVSSAVLAEIASGKLDESSSRKVDAIAQDGLASSGVPGASVAIVKGGNVVYLRAYGKAKLEPARETQPGMRFAVGSISKQFTAAAILLLAEEGKLKLDDPVAKFYSGLTEGSEITIRMLLSHTSGYSDYWPQDYVMRDMLQPVTPEKILDTWASKPLDFEPGTKWEYSNTNYVLAGQIVEKIAGLRLYDFLAARIFKPLGMTTVFNVDEAPLPAGDATGYYRHALGPLRVAPKEGAGWLSAAGELSMTAEDLARWDISVLKRSILKPASYDEMFKDVKTKDGKETGYGLGVSLKRRSGHRTVEHGGEVSGFVSDNIIFPDDGNAVVVLTNQDANDAASKIANESAPLLVGRTAPEERALSTFIGLQRGEIDRSQLTGSCSAYFSEQAINDFAASLKPLGEPLSITQIATNHRGGMTFRAFRIHLVKQNLMLTTYEMPDGKLEQYLISPRDSS